MPGASGRGAGEYGDAAGEYGDALTTPFWEGAREGRLLVQRCLGCGHRQFYPRPLCLECESLDVGWVEAAGTGSVYSLTTVHLAVTPELDPPYVVAVVELDEGPRLLTRLVDGEGNALADGASIGDRVVVSWHPREGAPPLPLFRPV